MPKLTSTTKIASGTTYFASADNAGGTGTAVTNGTATLGITVPDNGPNTLYVKAVNTAGTASAETSYLFYTGTTTPSYAYGDKMVTGYTATNTDTSTTVVPPATTTSTGGHLITQSTWPGVTWADGAQGMLANNLTAGTDVASGDSATFSFDVPAAGYWDIGMSLTEATDYGTYNLTVDGATATPITLATGFDAYSSFVTTHYEDFGFPENSAGTPVTLTQGVHTLTLTLTGKDTNSTGYQAGLNVLRLAPVTTCGITTTTGCLNNTAFGTYTAAAGSTPAKVTSANADGWGYSFNLPDLAGTGWPTNGGDITADGATIALPKLGTGLSDNMLASGQTVTVPANTPGVVDTGDALVFLAFATTGDAAQATGTINYQTTTPTPGCSSSQSYTLDSVPDWATGPASAATLTLSHRNESNATQISTTPLHVYAISVPIACPGNPVTSISLPVWSNGVQGGTNSIHILGLGIRPSSSSSTSHLTGTWEAVNDTQAITNPAGSAAASISGQTLRIPATVSIGTDGNNQVRIHLSNATGTGPVTFNAASISLQDPTAGGANTTGVVVSLTFNGSSSSITLPAGADAVSDPATLAVPPQATVLVSLDVQGTVTRRSGHSASQAPIYVSTSDGTNHTMDPTAASYSTGGISGVPYLSGIDVSTPDSVGALVLYGDQTVNSDTTASNGTSHLNDEIADAMVANASGNGDGQVDYGILNGGTNSWTASNNLLPGGNAADPLNVLGPVDRAVLEQANVRTVLISTGTSDLRACPTTGTAAACTAAVEARLTQLASSISSYYNDDSQNINATMNGDAVTVYLATIPPASTPLTGIQEQAREQVNTDLLSLANPTTCSPGTNMGADGVIDFAGAVSTNGSATDAGGSTVKTADLTSSNPNNSYYTDLANAYLNGSTNSCLTSPSPN